MDNCVLMDFSKLPYAEFDFIIREVVPQHWVNDRSWTEFIDKPRDSSALLMIVSDTTVRYTANTGEILTASNGDVIYCPYGSQYRFDVISDVNDDNYNSIKTICVNFNMVRNDKKIITLGLTPIKVVDFKNAQLENDFFDISKYALKPMMRKYKLYKIMKTLIDLYSNHSKNITVVKKAVQYIEENYKENIKISLIAERFGLSESHFRKLFKDFTNLSPVDYRNQLRVEHAKELLSQSNLPVSEVARSVGIEDQFYFSRIFKEFEGVSPLQYKKSV